MLSPVTYNHIYIKLSFTNNELFVTGNSLLLLEKLESIIKNYLTPVKNLTYDFPYGGHSGCIILSESHLTWHTYPEENFLVIDVYSCKKFSYNSLLNELSDSLNVSILDYEVIEKT